MPPPPPPLPAPTVSPSSLGPGGPETPAPTPAYLGLAIHRGAIDKTTITNHAPPEAMRRVRVALQSMGVIVQAEGEYRYRCIRPRRLLDSEALVDGRDLDLVREDESSPMLEAGLPPELTVSATAEGGAFERPAMTGSLQFEDALPQTLEDEVTPTNLHPSTTFDSPATFTSPPSTLPSPPPVPHLSSAHTHTPHTLPSHSSTATSSSASSDVILLSTPSGPHAIAYGKHTEDPGDEVRFSVEITRFDRLDGTYSLDIRRLKGNLRSYKFVYDSVRTLAVLQ